MKESVSCPPVLFLIFNRPDLTQRVFKRIRQAKPEQLFIAADGPRSNIPSDSELCTGARTIIKQVDWECQVRTLLSESNLGCKMAVSKAIDWFFKNVQEGIILEDDCIPSQSFFLFCREMLERFRHDNRIMMVTGLNRLEKWKSELQDYHFAFGGIWGWATWRRAWQHYDVDIQLWKDPRARQALKDFVVEKNIYSWLEDSIDKVSQGSIDTWDYQWVFVMGINSGLSVVPSKNLINNIGFGPEATHTVKKNPKIMALSTFEINFPLRHNNIVAIDREYMKLALSKVRTNYTSLKQKILIVLRRFYKKFINSAR